MHPINDLLNKDSRLVVGIMSGTSADGIDVALCRINGHGPDSKIEQLAFYFEEFTGEVKEKILNIAGGGLTNSKELCKMNFLLGRLYASAVKKMCDKQGLDYKDIDLIASHGQTFWHIPKEETYLGHSFKSTLQMGETSILAEEFGCPVIGDFRVRDVAAGGFGAPLVPYSEFLIYRSKEENIALQNIGGIGNITFIRADCELDDVFAFDTGPGNMLIDAIYSYITKGKCTYDCGGDFASKGMIDEKLLAYLMKDEYVRKVPPKTTGREYYGSTYVDKILKVSKDNNISDENLMATITAFTAKSIAYSVQEYLEDLPDKLIVGGGGSKNKTLIKYLKEFLPECKVLLNEDLGIDSDAKEAVAFAVLGNEALFASYNNVPNVTQARRKVVMGKITF